MIRFSRIVEGRTGILRSLGKRPPRADERDIFFVEPVEKPTDTNTSRCFATTTDCHPHAEVVHRPQSSSPTRGPTPCRPSKLYPVELINGLSRLHCQRRANRHRN